jgi:two-component system, NtrC family, response regulator AtoC
MTANSPIQILLVEDEEFDVERVRRTVRLVESRIRIADVVSNGKAALDYIGQKPDRYDIVILDFQISGGLRGEELIRKMKDLDPLLQIIVITKMTMNMTDLDFASSLLRAGAFWYCTKYPGNIEEYIYQPTDFILSVYNAYEKRRLEKQHQKSDRRLMKNVELLLETKKIHGASAPIIQLKESIERYAKSEANILVTGASGTGKELVAWNIHLQSRRKFESFVAINCGGMPPDLIESELFGYEKGSFTGANASKPGLFEMANNGTVFLDEVSELPPPAQVKVLRVIQDGEIEKIGRRGSVSVNVRIIAATNKELSKEVMAGRFREDLFYRLNVIPLDIVPLKDRGDDILLLFEHFLGYFSDDMGIQTPEVDQKAKEILMHYKWPGNVRELRNVAQRLVLNTNGRITAKEVSHPMILRSAPIADGIVEAKDIGGGQILPLKDIERIFRTNYFKYVRSISSSDSNAADRLGLAPSNFYRMCKELGLK